MALLGEVPDPDVGPRDTRVVVADSSHGIRLLFAMALPQFGDFDVVAVATNAAEALAAVEATQPDLLLIDSEMEGARATVDTVCEQNPAVRVLVFASPEFTALAQAKTGAHGVLEKGEDISLSADLLVSLLDV